MRAQDVGNAMARLLERREPMQRALALARDWERAVTANRSSVFRRIAAL